ncbi:uncharacterized protein EI90DRAFT_3017000 [Cantharellus anzutake]|uniref:uncharacterized protein n=1 Tax=Cantharellus anzutake TaxID=1750568 RepID=UPI0019072AEC|nr:uncharacterized protein EI90DRAFT_3017000 [Cantharellus anzutake]KAF8330074.1 hypothetical protein EI90DRAFT_3017000 [Cantharellus anzutake]
MFQYRYECKDSAEWNGRRGDSEGGGSREEMERGEGQEGSDGEFIVEQESTDKMLHARRAIEIAKAAQVLPDATLGCDTGAGDVKAATERNCMNGKQLAVGSKVVITTDINTDVDMANGARGDVIRTWPDPCEEGGNEGASLRAGAISTGTRDTSTIPSFLVVKTTEYKAESGAKQKVERRQVTLDGACYAFTDYRAQGQTIEYSWAEIGTPLNAYITLSRT